MSDPPVQRPASRDEFRSLLEAFKVSPDAMVIDDAFGYGVKTGGDRRSADRDLASAYGVLQLSNLAYSLRAGRGGDLWPDDLP